MFSSSDSSPAAFSGVSHLPIASIVKERRSRAWLCDCSHIPFFHLNFLPPFLCRSVHSYPAVMYPRVSLCAIAWACVSGSCRKLGWLTLMATRCLTSSYVGLTHTNTSTPILPHTHTEAAEEHQDKVSDSDWGKAWKHQKGRDTLRRGWAEEKGSQFTSFRSTKAVLLFPQHGCGDANTTCEDRWLSRVVRGVFSVTLDQSFARPDASDVVSTRVCKIERERESERHRDPETSTVRATVLMAIPFSTVYTVYIHIKRAS